MQPCDLRIHDVIAEPFAHIGNEQFIAPELFRALRDSFPDCPPSSGPTGFSLYWQDEEYQRLLHEQPQWRTLYDVFNNQEFINWAIAQFGETWQRDGLKIDLSKARYVPYHEDRIDKERSSLRKVEHAPEELWVRMDIHQGRAGYARAVHRDHARRLMSMLIYFSDASLMSGGELLLHGSLWKRLTRRPVVVAPRENLMVAFPCNDRSFHSVPRIVTSAAPRNYMQIQISSSVSLWPRA
jgi:hypothetical protein